MVEKKLAQIKIGNHAVVFIAEKCRLSIVAIGDGFWQCSLSESDVRNLSNLASMTEDQYITKLLESVDSTHSSQTQLSILEKDTNLKLTWAKELKKGIKVIFGIFNLNLSANFMESSNEFFHVLFTHLNMLNLHLRQLKSENESLKAITNAALKKYEDIVSQEEAKELTLLTKFACILNEKKRKIVLLENKSSEISIEPVVKSDDSVSSVPSQSSNGNHRNDGNGEEDQDLLLPKIARTSKNLLGRSYALTKNVLKKQRNSTIKEENTDEKDEKNCSVDDLLSSL